MIGDSDDKINFPHELLLTNRQVSNLRKTFADKSSTDIKLWKTQIFLGRILGPLLKTGLALMKNVIKPVAKSVLIPLGLTATASAVDVGIHKKNLGSGRPLPSASHDNNIILIISNNEMKDIIKIVKSIEDSGLLMEGVSKTIQNEAKNKEEDFLVRY